MEFAKQFSEAAQKAVLSTIESGDWVKFPWMETLIKQAVREGLKGEETIGSDVTINPLNRLVEDTPRDICGCPAGFCTCNTTVITKSPPCSVWDTPKSATGIIRSVEKHDESFESNSFDHVDGYDWRIFVSDRGKNHRNSWVENFSRPPTQEEFEYQFRHFHARTHYVHVNYWVDGAWTTITSDYVPQWNKEKPKETFTATEEWPEGKKWRIKFHDQRIGRENYVYFDGKPGGIVLAKYHSAKCFAVVEARPDNA